MIKFFQTIGLAAAVLLAPTGCDPKSGSKLGKTPAQPNEPNNWVTPKPVTGSPEMDTVPPVEYTIMNPVDVVPANVANPDTLLPYNPAATQTHDLLHTKIEISFDWDKKRANGKATLRLKPWFYATDQLTLDAKNFDIKSVTLANNQTLKHNYNNEQIQVQLDRSYKRTEEFTVVITYTAKPDERTGFGGSAAITSDKGLYFILPSGQDPNKPRQIWTQGETESNSFWFPTIDKPNERCTQEMYITVENKYKTLSNGTLVSSTPNAGGTRTDYWKMDMPHAPYLFMMAVGEYAVVKDKWRGKDVNYFVEPKYEAYARDIFPYTLEMLDFFSGKLNYPYPWQKYDQVIVRDYVSGAMENTTAVIFGDYMQKTKRELLDVNHTNEKVVAHEMFHHWFGDLVTTESWANLTLNEGFANYSEYLWMEHKHGAIAADEHLQNEHQGYMFSASDGGHPLIHYRHANREDMFDAHSYNKGGSVLHMLRHYLGDEAFFAGLNAYLEKHKFTQVEAHELRMAFEDVTGEDLNWFFDQWYFGAGHPSVEINYNWNETAKAMEVTIEQQQTAQNEVAYIFNLPIDVDIYDASGKARRERIRMTKRKQMFSFKANQRPAVVNVDATKSMLWVKSDKHSEEEWRAIWKFGLKYLDRMEAFAGLAGENGQPTSDIAVAALSDASANIRQMALGALDLNVPAVLSVAKAPIIKLAETDPNPEVRAMAIEALGTLMDAQYLPIIQKGLLPDAPFSVSAAALSAMNKMDQAGAQKSAKTFEQEDNQAILAALAEVYAQTPSPDQLTWFQQQAKKADQQQALVFFEHYQKYINALGNPAAVDNAIQEWKTNALTPESNSDWRRFASTKALADTRNDARDKGDAAKEKSIQAIIDEIKGREVDPTLKLYYSLF